jgi:hypothetical protein
MWRRTGPITNKDKKRYHRNYSVEKPFYQYNGGMNADWDDKDYNGTTRQRWFKDIYTGDGDAVEYAPEFKGMMINLSGLDYWEQKYQRFNVDRQGRFLFFEGGPYLRAVARLRFDAKQGRKAEDRIAGNDREYRHTCIRQLHRWRA